MNILAIKPGHDGAIACIEEGELRFSFEAEKDSYPRYSSVHPELLLEALQQCEPPDVLALGGWMKGFSEVGAAAGAGYFGVQKDPALLSTTRFFGKQVEVFRSSHERSHLAMAFGMSPLEESQPCYVLVWEGAIGAFYHLSSSGEAKHLGTPLTYPGGRFLLLYHIAHPDVGFGYFSSAGKTMALAGFARNIKPTIEENLFLDRLLRLKLPTQAAKSQFASSPLFNRGVETEEFQRMARLLTDTLFDRFADYARTHLPERLPLLINGGCGLNCEWNTRWRECGLFSEVFVPPCTNDAGSAIGTAVDALSHYTGQRKITWNVYAGQSFIHDCSTPEFERRPIDLPDLARQLGAGEIIPWVQGRCEIGPRALGHRSLLASPSVSGMQDRLNCIKRREHFRPVAPICREVTAHRWFDGPLPSPHMLYFHEVKDSALTEIRHVDGTARVQTINGTACALLDQLLQEVGRQSGYDVLCNTSLNFPGLGFINRMSDLLRFTELHHLRMFVVDEEMYLRPDAQAQ